MTREDIAAYMMRSLMSQKSTSPAVEGTEFDYVAIADLAYLLADMLIDIYASSGDPDLAAVLAMEAMVSKVLNDGSDFDYTDIVQAAYDMSVQMSGV